MKTFVKYSVFGVLALGMTGVALSGPVAAKGRHAERERPSFEKIDINADGFITAEELQAGQKARFDRKDANGDGFLTLEELQASVSKRFEGRERQPDADRMADRTTRMLRYLDENGDGKVAFDEMPARDHSRMIERMDTDDDGKVSSAEFEEARDKFRKGRGGKHRH